MTDPRAIVAAVHCLEVVMDRIEVVASRFRPDSEICQLQQSAHDSRPVTVSPDLFDLLSIAVRAASTTGGAVDPTVGGAMQRIGYDRDFSEVVTGTPGTLPEATPVPGWEQLVLDEARSTVLLPEGVVLDLGATAKACAADRAAAAIADGLGCGVLVSLGGDLSVRNAPAGGFAVGIADVCGDAEYTTTVAVSTGGLATSGVGSRYWDLGGTPVHHLIDPATSLPLQVHWRTASVAAGTCVDANIASTAALVLGEAAPAWLEMHQLPARLVHSDGSVVPLGGWPDDGVNGGSGECR